MGTTSNYSWPTPEATDLVKDGWEAIKDLGDAIDTTAAAQFGGGLKLIDSETFTGVSAVTFDDVFSATYKNYLILVSIQATSTTAVNLTTRLRVGGVAASGSNYSHGSAESNSSGVTNRYALNATSWNLQGTTFANVQRCNLLLFDPFQTKATGASFSGISEGATGNYRSMAGGADHSLATSYDGIEFNISSGTIDGHIEIYGVRV